MPLFKVYDDHILLFRRIFPNSLVCCLLGAVQLVVAAASLGQHFYSFVHFKGAIFACRSQRPAAKSNWSSQHVEHVGSYDTYMSYDLIVFDFRLFEKLWGIVGCIANHMDGGYMRCAWCISQCLTILGFFVVVISVKNPKPLLIFPLLSLQSFYSIGLLVLTLSAVPKILPTIFSNAHNDAVLPLLAYTAGVSMNFFLTYVLWHYYWHLESLHHRPKTLKTAGHHRPRPYVQRRGSDANREGGQNFGTPLDVIVLDSRNTKKTQKSRNNGFYTQNARIAAHIQN